jgi:hypothetical protein
LEEAGGHVGGEGVVAGGGVAQDLEPCGSHAEEGFCGVITDPPVFILEELAEEGDGIPGADAAGGGGGLGAHFPFGVGHAEEDRWEGAGIAEASEGFDGGEAEVEGGVIVEVEEGGHSFDVADMAEGVGGDDLGGEAGRFIHQACELGHGGSAEGAEEGHDLHGREVIAGGDLADEFDDGADRAEFGEGSGGFDADGGFGIFDGAVEGEDDLRFVE